MLNMISFLKMLISILDKKTKNEWELEIHNGSVITGYCSNSGLELVAGFKAVPKAMGMSVQVDLDIESDGEKMVESREAFLIKEPKDTNSVAEWFLDQIEIAEDELFASGKKFASSKKFAKTHLDGKSILKMLLTELNMTANDLQGDWQFGLQQGVLTGEDSQSGLELVAGMKIVPKSMGMSVQVDLDIESDGEKMVESREAFLITEDNSPVDIEDMTNWFADQIGFAEESILNAPQKFASRRRRASFIRGRYGR